VRSANIVTVSDNAFAFGLCINPLLTVTILPKCTSSVNAQKLECKVFTHCLKKSLVFVKCVISNGVAKPGPTWAAQAMFDCAQAIRLESMSSKVH